VAERSVDTALDPENETADPEPLRLLGPDGIVVKAHHFPELFAEAQLGVGDEKLAGWHGR